MEKKYALHSFGLEYHFDVNNQASGISPIERVTIGENVGDEPVVLHEVGRDYTVPLMSEVYLPVVDLEKVVPVIVPLSDLVTFAGGGESDIGLPDTGKPMRPVGLGNLTGLTMYPSYATARRVVNVRPVVAGWSAKKIYARPVDLSTPIKDYIQLTDPYSTEVHIGCPATPKSDSGPQLDLQIKLRFPQELPSEQSHVRGHAVDGGCERFYDGYALYEYNMNDSTIRIAYPLGKTQEDDSYPSKVYTLPEFDAYLKELTDAGTSEISGRKYIISSVAEQAGMLRNGGFRDELLRIVQNTEL